jgi:hypothetical protein
MRTLLIKCRALTNLRYFTHAQQVAARCPVFVFLNLDCAQTTLKTILGQIDQPDLPVQKTWRLNERLVGKTKFQRIKEYSTMHLRQELNWNFTLNTELNLLNFKVLLRVSKILKAAYHRGRRRLMRWLIVSARNQNHQNGAVSNH